MQKNSIKTKIDEEMVFNQLDNNENAIWSLLLAGEYLKVVSINEDVYELELTNFEVAKTFGTMVENWFGRAFSDYNDFIKALLCGNLKEMNAYMNRISLAVFSFFDGGNHPSELTMPEEFYHGFVLRLLVELRGRYEITSNRESGFERYDVLMSPLCNNNDGIILEFKVYDPDEETSLKEIVQRALKQIEEKKYEQMLLEKGIRKKRIRKYGFAFEGKKVLIGQQEGD